VSLVIYHSDVHGGLSGFVALKALSIKSYSIVHHFSNFDRNPPARSILVSNTEEADQIMRRIVETINNKIYSGRVSVVNV